MTALVTGASGGLGSAIAKALAGQGARVTAGGMAAKGQALLLLPKGAAQRAQAVR